MTPNRPPSDTPDWTKYIPDWAVTKKNPPIEIPLADGESFSFGWQKARYFVDRIVHLRAFIRGEDQSLRIDVSNGMTGRGLNSPFTLSYWQADAVVKHIELIRVYVDCVGLYVPVTDPDHLPDNSRSKPVTRTDVKAFLLKLDDETFEKLLNEVGRKRERMAAGRRGSQRRHMEG